ncbi:YdeI/OmpD-associated family protein [Nocardia gipuzkoensis]
MKFQAHVEPPELVRGLEVPPEVVVAHVRAVESAKRPDTRQRRIEKAIATLRG